MIPIPEVTDLDLAFPAGALEWMPEWDDIPEEFRDDWSSFNGGWCHIASHWFYNGLPATVEFYPKEGVDAAKAVRACQATLGSYAPKHEHKIAAVGYMLSQWFDKIEGWK